MTATAVDKRLEVWQPFAAGHRVRVTARFARGEIGTVVERLDGRADGMGRYAVLLDRDDRWTGRNVTDVCWHEITRHKPKRPRPC